MVGPTLEEALVEIDHRLHLESENVSYLESLIPRLIDGVTRGFMIALPTAAMGASSSSFHQVGIIPLSVCLCPY